MDIEDENISFWANSDEESFLLKSDLFLERFRLPGKPTGSDFGFVKMVRNTEMYQYTLN